MRVGRARISVRVRCVVNDQRFVHAFSCLLDRAQSSISLHFCRSDDFVFIFSRKANDQADDDANKTTDGQPEDIPGHGKAEDQAEDPDIQSHRSIFRQMNIFILLLCLGPAPVFVAHKGSS